MRWVNVDLSFKYARRRIGGELIRDERVGRERRRGGKQRRQRYGNEMTWKEFHSVRASS